LDKSYNTFFDVKRENKTFVTKFTGTDYNPSILDFDFDNDWINPITPSFANANELLTFDITEEASISTSGTVTINLGFTWTAVNTGTYNIYAIPDFIDEDGEDTDELPNIEANRIYLAKSVSGNSYIAKNVGLEENRYRVFIQEVDNLGNYIEVSYTVDGKYIAPTAIDSATYTESGNIFSFYVSYSNKPYDFKQYNLYYNNVLYDSYITDTFKTELISGTDLKSFSIEAQDTSGNVSDKYSLTAQAKAPSIIDSITWEEAGNIFSFSLVYSNKPDDFKEYQIYYNNTYYDTFLTNSYSTDIIYGLDVKKFTFYAVDTGGNKSTGYLVEAQATRPPKADYFYSEILDDKSLKFTFETSNKPDDFAGYYLRYHRGINYDWDSATSFTNDLILSAPYISKAYFSEGTYTFLLRTVNTAGDTSTDSSVITTNLGEALIENLVYQKDFHPLFEGSITNGNIQNDILSAIETDEEYWDKDTLEYWGDDTSLYWGTNTSSHWSNTNLQFWGDDTSEVFWKVENTYPMTYESSFVSDGSGFLKVNYEGLGSPKIYVRLRDNVTFWGDDGETFWEDDTDIFWDIADYIAYSEEIQITPDADYDIKVYFDSVNGYLPNISELSVLVDAKDIFETFEDVIIPIEGYSISPTKDFDVIKVVNVTIQDDGGSARQVRVDKSGYPYEVYVYDENNNITSGIADIIIQGY